VTVWIERYWKNIAVVIGFAVALWFLWPAPKVANLGSRGTSIIAFGDSLTAGYGASAGEDYPSRLSALIATPIINAGISGDTTESALARVDADVTPRDPRIVIVGLGGNDFLRGVAMARRSRTSARSFRKSTPPARWSSSSATASRA